MDIRAWLQQFLLSLCKDMTRLIVFILFFIKAGVLYANDHCYAMYQVRIPENNPQAHFDGTTPNPEDAFFLTDYQERILHYQNFQKMVEMCQELCLSRGSDCRGYITGNCIELAAKRDPEGLMKKLMPPYCKESDGIEEPLKEVDCICVREKDVNEDIDHSYTELKDKFIPSETVFNMIFAIVAFWQVLHGSLMNVDTH